MRYLLPALTSGLILAGAAIVQAQNSTTITTGPGGVSGSTTVTNSQGKPCRIVHADSDKGSGSMSSSVTAGGGSVSSSTSGGGSSVTVHSGNSGASSSASASGSSSGGTTTMTSSDGDCVIVVPKDSQATTK
jgi:hypothetical protein